MPSVIPSIYLIHDHRFRFKIPCFSALFKALPLLVTYLQYFRFGLIAALLSCILVCAIYVVRCDFRANCTCSLLRISFLIFSSLSYVSLKKSSSPFSLRLPPFSPSHSSLNIHSCPLLPYLPLVISPPIPDYIPSRSLPRSLPSPSVRSNANIHRIKSIQVAMLD